MLKAIPSDKQLLDIAKADLEIKIDIMVELRKSNQEHAEQMKALTGTLVNLSNALTAALNPQPHPNPYQYSGHHHSQQHFHPGYSEQSFTNHIPTSTRRAKTYQESLEEIDEAEHTITELK